MLDNDTHPAIARVQQCHQRCLTADQKLQQVCEMNAFVWQAAQADIRRRYPEADAAERLHRALQRYYPASLLDKALAARRERGFG
jgi:hypothetical protein